MDVIPKKRTLKLMNKGYQKHFRHWLPYHAFPGIVMFSTSAIAAADAEYCQALAVTANQPLEKFAFAKRTLLELKEVLVFQFIALRFTS
jgi:hypothetical protein